MATHTVRIVIPTYNRAHLIERALDAALRQTHPDVEVLVVDDHGHDDTWRILSRYESHPRFGAIRLSENGGTAAAKNAGIFGPSWDAITFHDSDDVPHIDKVLRQARAMNGCALHHDGTQNWDNFDVEFDETVPVSLVVGSHDLVLLDGTTKRMGASLSLLDDFFPNVRGSYRGPNDWSLVNAGLFHRRVFHELGGFLDSIEEDRELRNRIIASGMVVRHLGDQPLLTKYEEPDSLTVAAGTNLRSASRMRDREHVWQRLHAYQGGMTGPAVGDAHRVPVDPPEVESCLGWARGVDQYALSTPIEPDLLAMPAE